MNLQAAKQHAIQRGWAPRAAVWEITRRCDLRCGHCGTSAGRAREGELSTAEALDVIEQLVTLGCEFVSLSGGEPTLREDWDVLTQALTERGVRVNMVSNGQCATPEIARGIARRALAAGMSNIGVSLDGPEALHEALRGRGTFKRALSTVSAYVSEGLPVSVMTTVDKRNLPHLAEIREIAMEAGASMWRAQLCKPMGNADREHILDPHQMVELMSTLAVLQQMKGIRVFIGDSVGYYGPRERALRGGGALRSSGRWRGCQAGRRSIGIEADGGIKGCLSMQAKAEDGSDPFIEGSLKAQRLAEIWYAPDAFTYNRAFHPSQLTGPCAGCRHGAVCRGGARCVSSALSGRLTEDTHCYYAVTHPEHQQGSGVVQKTRAFLAAAALLGAAGCIVDEDDQSGDAQSSYDALIYKDYGAWNDYAAVMEDAFDVGVKPDEGAWADYAAPMEDASDAELDEGAWADYAAPIEDAFDVGVEPDEGAWADYAAPIEDASDAELDEGAWSDYAAPMEDASDARVEPDEGAWSDYAAPMEDAFDVGVEPENDS